MSVLNSHRRAGNSLTVADRSMSVGSTTVAPCDLSAAMTLLRIGSPTGPSVSVPTAATARAAAATTPEPELEPHGLRSRTYGMLVWPPTPLHPLEDGPDRKLAHSDRLALPMMIAPAAFSCFAMNASAGVLPASAQEPAVVGIPVVSMLSLTMIGIPSSGR